MTGCIQTFSGVAFDPFEPNPEMIRMTDIAHSLAHQCRYTGHCKRFYSIAEHCVRLAAALLKRTGDVELAKYALLHDASEAYLSDISRPLKVRPEFAFYREVEAKLTVEIYRKFGLMGLEPGAVKKGDTEILGTEARILFNSLIDDCNWGGPLAPVDLDFIPRDLGYLGWTPVQAERCFWAAFRVLWGQRGAFLPERVAYAVAYAFDEGSPVECGY